MLHLAALTQHLVMGSSAALISKSLEMQLFPKLSRPVEIKHIIQSKRNKLARYAALIDVCSNFVGCGFICL